jgi:uncharacterized protein (TIRG00374 family)
LAKNRTTSMTDSTKKWGKFIIRWTIAAVGIAWVVYKTPLYDKVTIVNPANNLPVKVSLAEDTPEKVPASVKIIDPKTGQTRVVPRDELVTPPDAKYVKVRREGGAIKRRLLAMKLNDEHKKVEQLLVEKEDGTGEWLKPNRLVNYKLNVPYPLVDQGIVPMVKRADHSFLWGAVLIFPVTFLITSFRWHLLLHAVGIMLGAARAFVINMVGAFYNTFMPGSTGGDVLKAYYAAKLAPHRRTYAVMSVIVDRIIGLLALIILGGAMAAKIALAPHEPDDPVADRCAQIAIGAAALIAAMIVGLTVLFTPALRRLTGLDFLLKRLPMQNQVQKALHTLELYRNRPWLSLMMIVMSFPVHIIVIFSAMCAGLAFKLPLTPGYYWVVVPVIVLAGSVPISPQGAGVMEFFAVLLTSRQGASVSEAVALTMSIRLVQIFWNLCGGIFVLRGGFHAPTTKEQEEIESESIERQDAKARS